MPGWTYSIVLGVDGPLSVIEGTGPRRLLESVPVTTLRGTTELGTVRPCEIRCRVLDPGHALDPDNPASPVYGQLGRRTAISGQHRPPDPPETYEPFPDANGELYLFAPGQTADYTPGPPTRGYQWTDLVGAGVLRRIGQWAKLPDSPLRVAVRALPGLTGYWPLEDPKTATQVSNLVAGGPAGRPGGLELAATDGPAGTAPIARTSGPAPADGVFRAMPPGPWTVGVLLVLSGITLPGTATEVCRVTTVHGHHLRCLIDATALTVQVWTGGALAGTIPMPWAGVAGGSDQSLYVSLLASPSGSNAVFQVQVYAASGAGMPAGQYTLTGASPSTPDHWWIYGAVTGVGFGHLYGAPGADLGVAPDLAAAQGGHRGEGTADRFLRLCAQHAIPGIIGPYVSGVTGWELAGQVPMGPQPREPLLSLLAECATTEGAILTDEGDTLVYRVRRSLYRPPVLELAFTDVGQPFEPVSSDVDSASQVLARNRNGSEALAALPGVPAGLLDATQLAVNVVDEGLLASLAGAELNRLAQPGPRVASVVLDAGRVPALADAAGRLEIGDVVTVAGYATRLPLRLLVIGIGTTTSAKRRTVTLSTAPATYYNVGYYNDGGAAGGVGGSRYDVAGSTLGADLAAGATTVTVHAATAFDVWSIKSAPPAVPWDWQIGPEIVRVTAMGAPSANPPYVQTATVIRNVNGVGALTRAAGSRVSLAYPVYYGW